MDTQNNDGSELSLRQQFRNLDLLGFETSAVGRAIGELCYSRPEAFNRLVEAISQGNPPLKNQILRHWGIR